MANLELRKFINFLGYIATMLIALALAISLLVSLLDKGSGGIPMFNIVDVVSALTCIASIIAFLVTIICGFLYAKSKRNHVFIITQTIATMLIVLSMVLAFVL